MDERYTGEIEQASELLAEALLAKEQGLAERALDVDGVVLLLLRRAGRDPCATSARGRGN